MAETQKTSQSPSPEPDATARGAAESSPAAIGGRQRRGGPLLIGLLVALLIVLHQDYWFWSSDFLVFGLAPIGLFYHACLSLVAAAVWLLATKIAWPVDTIVQAQVAAQVDGAEPGATKEADR